MYSKPTKHRQVQKHDSDSTHLGKNVVENCSSEKAVEPELHHHGNPEKERTKKRIPKILQVEIPTNLQTICMVVVVYVAPDMGKSNGECMLDSRRIS